MKRKQIVRMGIVLMLFFVLATLSAFAVDCDRESGENIAPIVEDMEFRTFRGITLRGNLVANDFDGDRLEFQIIRQPRRGTIELDHASGEFVYTPPANRRSRDNFSFVAIDVFGNISQEANVEIRINRQTTQIGYLDMQNHSAELAALMLAEQGIFVGEQIGGNHFFNPDAEVTRGEFLAISIRLVDLDLMLDYAQTGFYDDAEIRDWLRPYVTTAVIGGYLDSFPQVDGKHLLAPDTPITFGEAAVILNGLLRLPDVPNSGNIMYDIVAPVWAHQASVNLRTHHIISCSSSSVYLRVMTRADVALMLERVRTYLER